MNTPSSYQQIAEYWFSVLDDVIKIGKPVRLKMPERQARILWGENQPKVRYTNRTPEELDELWKLAKEDAFFFAGVPCAVRERGA